MLQEHDEKPVPILYHHGMSVCAAKVRVVLEEKHVQWQQRYLDIRLGEHKTAAYLKLNPAGVVPTLVCGDDIIIESSLICEYINEYWAGPTLMPQNLAARAKARWWVMQLDKDIHYPVITALTFGIALRHRQIEKWGSVSAVVDHYLRTGGSYGPFFADLIEKGIESDHVASAVQRYRQLMLAMDSDLRKTRCLAGDELSLADLQYASYMARAESLQLSWLWEDLDTVTHWYAVLKERPSFTNAIVNWFDQQEIDVMKAYGCLEMAKLEGLTLLD